MALINCPECGNKVSDKAATCPHCGIDIQKELKPLRASESPFITEGKRRYKERKGKPFNKLWIFPYMVIVSLVFVAAFDLADWKKNKEPEKPYDFYDISGARVEYVEAKFGTVKVPGKAYGNGIDTDVSPRLTMMKISVYSDYTTRKKQCDIDHGQPVKTENAENVQQNGYVVYYIKIKTEKGCEGWVRNIFLSDIPMLPQGDIY